MSAAVKKERERERRISKGEAGWEGGEAGSQVGRGWADEYGANKSISLSFNRYPSTT